VLSLTALLRAAEPETIRLRADTWMPYNGDPTGTQPGFAIELARQIFGARGIAIDYQTMPWTEALAAVADGKIEGVIGANSKEAAQLVVPAEPIGLPRVGLFVRKDSGWRFSSVPALRKLRMGAIESYSYWDSLDRYIADRAGAEVTVYKGDVSLTRAIADLDAGKIDVMPETASVFIWTLKELGRPPTDFHLGYLHEGDPIFIAFTAKGDVGKRYAQILDAGIVELRRSGALKKLLDRYSLTDWK
jgi:polar amino acid transport system substrate-binding protein